MNVLSLFDGMSGGQFALQKAGIPYDRYYSSEIDKYAIEITQKNFPNTIQLGSVTDLYNWTLPKIDLLLGGSPCQGFSCAGKGLNWDDPRSELFFWYVRALRELKPRWWLFENVASMRKDIRDAISYELGVEPIMIDSSLVSAQVRKRYYWTNIPNVTQPKDRGIFLKDIIENGHTEKDKSYAIDSSYYKGGALWYYLEKKRRQKIFKHPIFVIAQRGRYNKEGKVVQMFETGFRGKTNTLTTVKKDNLVGYVDKDLVRNLTPLECERLQTVPEGATAGVSNTQRYKMLGNGYTVDVIAHILKGIKN